MTTLNFEIKTYTVMHGKSIGIGFANLNYVPSLISCQGAGGEQLLIAFAATQALADASSNFADIVRKRGGIVAPMSSFSCYIDILRNEGPVYGQLDSSVPNNLNLLKTGPEPVADPGQ